MALRQFACSFTVAILLWCDGCWSKPALECGLASKNTKIVGGGGASPGSWPWQAALVKNNRATCGGSLINKQWVLTAAHCVTGSEKVDTKVYLGRHSQSGPNANEVQRNVAQVACHPGYDFLTNENDICLLKLAGRVTFNDYVQPVCLAAAGSSFHAGVTGWVTGWGGTLVNGSSSPSDILQEVSVPVVGNKECQCRLPRLLITENMMCAGFKAGGKDACQGDSGGALVTKSNRRWVQGGIVSFGEGCAQPRSPGGYTRVSRYQDWIGNVTSNDNPGFVAFASAGVDGDSNYNCSRLLAVTTFAVRNATVVGTTAAEGADSIFDGGESVIRLAHFSHLVSLCVLALSLRVLA